MNDPVNGRDPAVEPVDRNGPGPLLWVLLIAAIVLIAWYWFGMRDGEEVEPLPPPTAETPAGEPAADAAIPTPDRPATAATPAPAAEAAGETRSPMPVASLQPEYPRDAFRNREEGRVLLSVQVDAAGNASDVQVATSSGSRELDRAATEAVGQWRFDPALEDGQAVASTVEVPIDFRLDE